jgi:hypothetical protein
MGTEQRVDFGSDEFNVMNGKNDKTQCASLEKE